MRIVLCISTPSCRTFLGPFLLPCQSFPIRTDAIVLPTVGVVFESFALPSYSLKTRVHLFFSAIRLLSRIGGHPSYRSELDVDRFLSSMVLGNVLTFHVEYVGLMLLIEEL